MSMKWGMPISRIVVSESVCGREMELCVPIWS